MALLDPPAELFVLCMPAIEEARYRLPLFEAGDIGEPFALSLDRVGADGMIGAS